MQTKITEEEIKKVNELQTSITNNTLLLGQIIQQEEMIKNDLSILQSKKEQALLEYKEISIKEEQILAELKDKYGEGEINVQSGTFTSIK
jgi:hypothetical protein